MNSRFPLGWALGLGVFYALVTVFFINGPKRADIRPLTPLTELAPERPALAFLQD